MRFAMNTTALSIVIYILIVSPVYADLEDDFNKQDEGRLKSERALKDFKQRYDVARSQGVIFSCARSDSPGAYPIELVLFNGELWKRGEIVKQGTTGISIKWTESITGLNNDFQSTPQ